MMKRLIKDPADTRILQVTLPPTLLLDDPVLHFSLYSTIDGESVFEFT
jgi:hypothetical protein